MNARQRFLATLTFEKVDRPFRWETPAFWPTTVKRWHMAGLPEDLASNEDMFAHFEMDRIVWLPFQGGWTGDPYCPFFEYRELEDDGTHLTIRDTDGIVKKIKKEDADTSMPQFLRFPVETRADYTSKIKSRFDPGSKERYPSNWEQLADEYQNRDYPIGMNVIGPFGHIRNLLGDEALMYLFYDQPDFVHEIMRDWATFYVQFMSQVCRDVVPDFIMIWEDMCYRSGPLVSPAFYCEFLSPYLEELISHAKSRGVLGIIVDNDGDCSKMLPLYVDCGANAFFPFEVQAGMNILKVRERYGNSFTIIGGIDKRKLALNEEAIRAEIDGKVPAMLEAGGYIPMLDHSVPTDVPLHLFVYYLNYVRALS